MTESSDYSGPPPRWSAFAGYTLLADGDPGTVALEVKKAVSRGADGPLLVFDRRSGDQVDVDLRGTMEDVLRWVERFLEVTLPGGAAPAAAGGGKAERAASGGSEFDRRGPGRPRLGVVSREVTLLPRHWEWLNRQSGGASAAIRRLVDEARVHSVRAEQERDVRERTYRFMSAIGGNLPGFEEAARALFSGDRNAFEKLVGAWPADVGQLVTELAGAAEK